MNITEQPWLKKAVEILGGLSMGVDWSGDWHKVAVLVNGQWEWRCYRRWPIPPGVEVEQSTIGTFFPPTDGELVRMAEHDLSEWLEGRGYYVLPGMSTRYWVPDLFITANNYLECQCRAVAVAERERR